MCFKLSVEVFLEPLKLALPPTYSKSPTTSSFSYPTGFKGAVNTEGPYALGATYTINLKRIASGSTWKLQIQCSY